MNRQDRKIADALTTEDLWKLMLRRVPPIVSEYFRGGADNETTMRANVRAFQQSLTTAHGALPMLKNTTRVSQFKLADTVDDRLRATLDLIGDKARVAVLPQGPLTIPYMA